MLAFLLVAVLPRATMPVLDGDAWWHIHAGREILESGQLSGRNTWTIASSGEPWISQDWLGNVLMAALFGGGGWGLTALSLFFGCVVVIAFGLLWLAARTRGNAPWLVQVTVFSAGLIVAGPIIGVRVQTLDLLFAAASVWALWQYRSTRKHAVLLALPVLGALWANVHGGWPMLFILGGAFVTGEVIDRVAHRSPEGDTLGRADFIALGGVLIVSALAMMLNPHGFRVYSWPFDAVAITALRDFVVEWAPPNPNRFEGQVTYAFIGVVVAPLLLLGHRSLRAADALWLLGLTAMTLSSVRFALFLGPIVAAIAASAIATRSQSHDSHKGSSSGSLRRVGFAVIVLAATVGILISIGRANPAAQTSQIGQFVPIGAADWVDAHRPNARIFNTYSWGGYLGWRLPHSMPYIDGRADIYGDAPIRSYAAALNVTEDPSTLLDEAAIDTVLVKPTAPIAHWLAGSDGWQQVYSDATAVMWVRISR
jgi:hypothetical protein